MRGLSSAAVSGGPLPVPCTGLSLWWLLAAEHGLWSTQLQQLAVFGLRCRSTWALECRLSSCEAWAWLPPRHVGFSRTRDQTRVPCAGRPILNHGSTRKVWSLIHFEFIFLGDVRMFLFHSFTCYCLVFPALLVEETVFSPVYILPSFVD